MGRQLLKAISHLYYGAPIESRFILHSINMEFVRWAQLRVDIEVLVTAEMPSQLKRADAPRVCGAALEWRQVGHQVAHARAKFTLLSAAMESKLMSRQYKQVQCA